jgi:asparagine synthase (glutamine-hydrolysing)
MSDAIAHRGPDDSGTWSDEQARLGLAHRRLSIIDPSPLGRQPMQDVDETAVITYNGEIYNFLDLRKGLIHSGYTFRSNTDTEVLLNLYRRDGMDMLPKLNGIFAFALWDKRNKTLLLARDGLGVKPLYYSIGAEHVLFASEIKALIASDMLELSIDEQAVTNYLTYLWSPPPNTMLESVKKLEPGCALLLRDGRIKRRWRFYELPYDQPIEELSESQAIEEVYDCVSTAVERQMISDVPVGAFLSGGLDSSSIVHFARQFTSGEQLQCFTISFPNDELADEGFASDEPYAKRVAKHLGVKLHSVRADPDVIPNLERLVYHLDEPEADPAGLFVEQICRLARDHGMKVLLSGVGGDDIFSGYRRHYALSFERRWDWLPKQVRAAMRVTSGALPTRNPLGRRIAKAFQFADYEPDERIAGYFHWITPDALAMILSPRLRNFSQANGFSSPLMTSLSDLKPDTPRLNKMLYLDAKHFTSDHNLNYTDKMSMATGVEVRVPLLDPNLVSLAARLPTNYKQRGRIGKWILKKAMEDHLPRDVIYRPKSGFGAPLRRWLHRDLRDIVGDTLSASNIQRRGLFDANGVQALLELDRDGRIDASYPLLGLVMIELWLRLNVDK